MLAWSGPKLFDTLMVFRKRFFEKVNFEKNQQTTKSMKNFPAGKELKNQYSFIIYMFSMHWRILLIVQIE